MGRQRGLGIAVAVVIAGGFAVWGIVEATSSGSDDVAELASTAREERVERRIERLERMLAAIDRAGNPAAARRAALARQQRRAVRQARVAARRARVSARTRAIRHRRRAAAQRACDPNYEGACLDATAADYDCSGGSGDGPEYTGRVVVAGNDHFGLDSNDNGIACEQG